MDMGRPILEPKMKGEPVPKRPGNMVNYAVGHHRGKVIVEYAEPIRWVGFDPDAAIKYATELRNQAIDAKAWLKEQDKAETVEP